MDLDERIKDLKYTRWLHDNFSGPATRYDEERRFCADEVKQLIRDVVKELTPSRIEIPEYERNEPGWSWDDARGYNDVIDHMEAKAKELGL